MGVSCNNATNNNTMIESLAEIMSHFSGEANHARCLAHIVNLVAKIILHQLDMSKKKKEYKKYVPETRDNKMAVDEEDNHNEVNEVDEEIDDML